VAKKKKDLKKYKETVVSIPIEEHLGEEKVDEIASKEHVAQDIPKKLSTKRKMSPNSLKNLVQYNPEIKKESKKKMLENLRVKVDEENLSEEQLEDLKEDPEDDNSLDFFKTLEVKVGGSFILLPELIAGVFPTYQTLDKKERVIFNKSYI
jgi:3-phosphoglycerate kinase